MRLLLDTNRYSDLVAKDPAVVSRFQQSQKVWLSFITIGGLRAGFALGTRQQQNEQQLQTFLNLQGVGILFVNEGTTHFYSDVYVALNRQGTKIPSNDMWIAAQALQHNLTLETHFKHVPNLKLA